jgi:hypothetical protein
LYFSRRCENKGQDTKYWEKYGRRVYANFYMERLCKPLCPSPGFMPGPQHKMMKEFTLVRTPMCVSYVGKPSLFTVDFEHMKELALERNHIYVSSVVKSSLHPVPFKHTEELTLEKNPMYVSIVA